MTDEPSQPAVLEDDAVDAGAGAPALHVRAGVAPKLNLSAFQNAVPALHELVIVNDTPVAVEGLTLTLTSSPAFVKPRTWHVESVGPGETYHLSQLDVQLDGALLSRLTEAESATLHLALRSRREPERLLASAEVGVELLARNQWGGLDHLPELVAAFVQPNDPAVDRVLKGAALALEAAGKPGALDGYAQGATRAWELASAIWTSVLQLKLHYALPPASFEHAGQKVRSPGQILDAGLATCLDTTLLFAACLEQARLNPLLVFTPGHAFAGVWLRDEEFATPVVDDITAVRKRLKLRELLVFETTLAAQSPAASFSQAIAQAERQLDEAQADAFELAIDVKRARMSRIRPLALAESPQPATPEAAPGEQALTLESAPELPAEVQGEAPAAALDPRDRLARWQRKLLDLSLRNALLNFKPGKKALVLEASATALEDALSGGQSIRLLPAPELMQGQDPRSLQLHEARSLEDLRRAHAAEALARRQVFIAVAQDELELRLVELYRSARLALQEGGANTLFVALGFLSWMRADKPDTRLQAPLILLPVTLDRTSVRSGFTLHLHEDEALFNPTLVEMLRQDFQLELGVPTGDLPRDDAGLDIAGIWASVRQAIKDMRGWEVSEDVVLAMFSFAKYLMWKDLTERTGDLRESPVVAHLLDTPREPYPSSTPFPDTARLDRDYPPQAVFSPLPADSSQLSAVMAAAQGKDFVLIGPPGTGKSQTIANLIAQCLAEGKRVLFVAEKIAALEVVYRRLRAVGLGDFCLELHSSKSRKLEVLGQLQNAWEARGEVNADDWHAKAQALARVREQLSTYVERLHWRHGNGLSVYAAIGSVTAGAALPQLGLSWPSADTHDAAALADLRELVARLQANAQAVGADALAAGPLALVHVSDWSARWQQQLMQAAQSVHTLGREFESAAVELQTLVGVNWPTLGRQTRAALGVLASILPPASAQDWRFCASADSEAVCAELGAARELLSQHRAHSAQLVAPWPATLQARLAQAAGLLAQRQRLQAELGQPWSATVAADLAQGLRGIEELQRLRAGLSVSYGAEAGQLNAAQLLRDWTKAEQAIWPLSALGKRKVRQALEAAIDGTGEARVADDLAALARIKRLREEVAALPLDAAAEVWAGERTRLPPAQAALQAHAALQAARAHQPFALDGLEPALQGECGERWAAEARRLKALHALDRDLAACADLAEVSHGLWRGPDTDVALLRAALAFEQDRLDLARRGRLPSAHAEVAQGLAGPVLQQQHAVLTARGAVEVQLLSRQALADRCPGVWQGLDTDEAALERALRFHASLKAALAGLGLPLDQLLQVRQRLQQTVWGAEPAVQAALGPACHRVQTALAGLHGAVDALCRAAGQPAAVQQAFGDQPPAQLVDAAAHLTAQAHDLHAWCAWRLAQTEARDLGLGALVDALVSGVVSTAQLPQAFEVNYARWWLDEAVDGDEVLKRFVAAEHERRIQAFRALDDEFTAITRQWIRARLCADLPVMDGVQRSSEWGILRREMAKKRQHLPLRQLLQAIPSAVLQLAPCLLMSPLSIAQYLSADARHFDLVVFDEASQIPVWDAIGAMARGRQVVMVGDPKQLPPTNFFDRTDNADDDAQVVEGDLESILDECLGASLPTRNLSWHYRSRHESLIAFSNHRYYGGGLVTFPSPFTQDQAVSLHVVQGRYEKGGARTNLPEARALVADLVAQLRSPEVGQAGLTLGVVTFNAEQQRLIEDLLDEERRQDPGLEPFFSDAGLEPVFVKNLESVQGDERDIMYFSITYGPDPAGVLSMNFGPLNRDGGERRLNVAVTRARHALRVFASLRGDQIDLSRTQAAGVRDLKHFLEFAERGAKALAEAHQGSVGDFESPFEAGVAQALRQQGWQVHAQIGASSFRVDLGVVHPDLPGRYLAGVECDGATYHRSATARDRDKLREAVLRGLGWEIERIWSTDWWVNPGGTLARLHARLNALLAADRRRRAAEAAARPVTPALAEPAAQADGHVPMPDGAQAPTTERVGEAVMAGAFMPEPASVASHDAEPANPPTRDGADEPSPVDAGASPPTLYARAPEQRVRPVPQARPGGPVMPRVLRISQPADAVPAGAVCAERFHEPAYDAVLQAMVGWVVQHEGPILDSVLARRIARAHGFQRTGSRIHERVLQVAGRLGHTTQEPVGCFHWPADGADAAGLACRTPADADSVRDIEEICMPELVSLARWVRAQGHHGDQALGAMARELGLSRLRAASRERLQAAVNAAAAA
ncbi:DNA helicase [Comamonas serinivorans]|uniref:DNA helicase n=1 Tax=Comamonas serinivorans TaxID=1082851 RepID=A0A1Y0EMN2_9BURK|nr:DUF3320 domain-containing protein [Comamonas serinivorans]ARU04589.1 DNA helicase [Comamonas serinivorans]